MTSQQSTPFKTSVRLLINNLHHFRLYVIAGVFFFVVFNVLSMSIEESAAKHSQKHSVTSRMHQPNSYHRKRDLNSKQTATSPSSVQIHYHEFLKKNYLQTNQHTCEYGSTAVTESLLRVRNFSFKCQSQMFYIIIEVE